ncbi:MAG: DNA polymerase III subunit gamma/tau [Acidobacteriota bacterium]|nr:DNA polymerase III subunit gamma/tau [Acidobacteriota bacterium]
MYQVIARKYRPQAFDELISQEHVKTTLENAITQQRIAHGYIFSGQRGTGKTSVARIFARCLNCEQGPTPHPCGKCASCLEIAAGSSMDVIEIDAASNRGINEMRELRESVRFRPARDRYKVFIVDEAHQITSEAFNALLKTLEEPPEWVVFLLCTTESHKIPSTIVSRCQQFSFRSVDFAELVKRMEWIMQQEGITADADAVAVLARAGEGSVRDSLSALDQAIACCGNKLNAAEVRTLLGMFSLESLGRVTGALAEGDSQKMFDVVAELEANGRSLQHFARELARHFRNLVVVKITGSDTRLIAASPTEQQQLAKSAQPFSEEDLTRYLQLSLDLFRDLQSSLQPRLHLEMGLLRMVQAGRLQPIEEALANLGSAPPPRTAAAPKPAPPVPQQASAPPVRSLGGGDLRSRLHAALLEAKLTHVADALEHSELAESPNELLFTTPKMYQLYLKQAEFEAAAKKAAGRPVRVTIKIGEAARQAAPAAAAPRQAEDEATTRALAHPEVKRFQEVFPSAQVRTVRNLKDN